jgi:hypothetical protein
MPAATAGHIQDAVFDQTNDVGPVVQQPPVLEEPTPPSVNWASPSSVALIFAGILSIIGFVFHKDLSTLAGPLAVLAVAIIGAAKAIKGAIEQKAYAAAHMGFQSLTLSRWAEHQNTLRSQPNGPALATFNDNQRVLMGTIAGLRDEVEDLRREASTPVGMVARQMTEPTAPKAAKKTTTRKR